MTDNVLLDVLFRIQDGIVALDENFTVTYVNKAFADAVGFEISEIIGKPALTIMPRVHNTVAFKEVTTAIAKREVRTFEWRGVYSGLFLETTVFPSDKGVTIIARDMTKRKQAETLLRKSEEELKAIISNAPIGIAITDSSGFILKANPSFCTILGYSENELRSLTFKDFTHPEDVAQSVELMGQLSSKRINSFSLEKRYIRKDREIINGKVTVSFIQNREAKPPIFIVELEDITERKKAEEILRASEERYRSLFEQAGDYILVLELPKVGLPIIRDANAAALKMHGYTREEFIGKSISLIDRQIDDTQTEKLIESVSTDKVVVFDVIHYRKDGSFFNAEVSVKAVKLGSETWILSIERDITERKKAEHELELYRKHLEQMVEEKTVQLKKAERLAAIGETAGMVGHDIRNPLQAMISDVYLLKDAVASMSGEKLKQDALESLDNIENNIGYIDKIVADLQDYHKLLKPQHVDLNLYELTINVVKSITAPDNVECFFEIDPSVRLKSDPTLISRILTNLVTNAFQAMPNGGKLLIEAYRIGGNVKIDVTDTGVGIPEQVKAKLFTPMFTTKAKGQGLGLAVVKRLVEALNGTISFESEEGKGAKFTFQLPLS